MDTKLLKVCAAVALFAAVGCKSDGNSTADLGGIQTSCTAGTKECLDEFHARVCAPEGNQWFVVTCEATEECKDGACVAKTIEKPPVLVCFPGDGKCMAGTSGGADQALTCKDDGSGYTSKACPTGTVCVGSGVCVGTCAVGSSICTDLDTVSTCANGTGYTKKTCDPGQHCVATGDTPFDTAACKTSACDPDPNGCNFVCGNKKDSGADQTKFISTCVETSTGYDWIAIACASGQICDPSGGAECAFAGNDAACAANCTEGTSMCDENGARLTCTEGKWSAPVACADGTVCISVGPAKTACGDAVCAEGTGTCTVDGKFRQCGADGKLGAAMDCASGTCIAESGATGDVIPGKCQDLCNDGDTRCATDAVPTQTFQTCVKGIWAGLDNCADGKLCFTTTAADGKTSHVCGECSPGATACGDFDVADPYKLAPIRTCSAAGVWGAYAACALGGCQEGNNPGFDDACENDCIPGAKYCRGGAQNNLPASYHATKRTDTCTTKGMFPISNPDASLMVTCATGTACRVDVAGAVQGCVECVYNNEYGLVDSQCLNGHDDIRFCTANNTWGTTTKCDDVKADTKCADPSDPSGDLVSDPIVFAAPALPNTEYCHACQPEPGAPMFSECTASQFNLFGVDCSYSFDEDGGGAPCPSRFGGTVSNCCVGACFKDSFGDLPKTAVCTTPN